MVQFRFNSKSRESVREVNLDISSGSDSDVGLIEDDPLVVRIPQGIISLERMDELMSRY